MGIILTLPPQLSNQIAAGEVVERPASIIKECVENSLDASAHHIVIKVSASGTERMTIQDDGAGVFKEDLILALARHATSKIKTVEDLFAIQTFGFRGEALASIASVSRCQLLSRPRSQPEAWQVYWNPQTQECQLTKSSHPMGSTIDIQDLFYTVPVRRKFLKSLKTEWIHIEEVVKRFALSHFEVGFDLFHNELPRWQLPPALNNGQRLARLSKCMGTSFSEKSTWIEAQAVGLRLTGWVAAPECARRQADEQHFFVNRRSIRDKMIAYVVKDVLSRYLGEGYYPSFVLYLEIDPENIDINVHPTKQEIRFREASHVQTFIRSAFEKTYQRTLVPLKIECPLPQVEKKYHHRNQIQDSPRETSIEQWQAMLLNKQYAVVSWGQNKYLVDYFACLKEILQNKGAFVPLLLPETLETHEIRYDFLQLMGFIVETQVEAAFEYKIQIKQVPKIFRKIPIDLLKKNIIEILNSKDLMDLEASLNYFFTILDCSKVFESAVEWQIHWPHLLLMRKIILFREESVDWGLFFKHFDR